MFIIFLKYCYFWASIYFFWASKNLKVMILLAQRASHKKVSVEPCLLFYCSTGIDGSFDFHAYSTHPSGDIVGTVIKEELHNRFNLISEERVKIFKHNSENLMNIG